MTVSAELTAFTCYAVFTRREPVSDLVAESTTKVIEQLRERGVTVRGLYDVATMPAGADLLVWLHGPAAQDLQEAVRLFEHQAFGGAAELTWSAMGVHRVAEFNRRHAPAFLNGAEPKRWLTVYPFVRSYEWYLLPEEERRRLLAEHGQAGREFPQVLSNTVAAFALGDYEWLLGLEADELIDLVDLMRHLRSSGARRHVRIEIPFYTGRRVSPAELAQVLR
ncbi:hydrogen peroxide-dependent heme synthase [Propionicimonas sp.]|uniref:hydrogen peroxide-dependent heme synthase n=1 Tax=Propionicimonas sp. TaxID=1955623 RepID=UPI00180C4B52|nr:hydrogen peroxide-dependent heme synthase [Propionicimonas sp.]MBU3976262.1 chlorite dismutase family protein [Actinomycetota bacterium]MBA3021074.1 chlorite dismutase family protein [Propionicimonas sp.]MBU3985657.1 chlorite dismutase family protein [Actinomycetota bacterium]MBU4008442.1 chlorite dismutase family protein [Actinomycetota bacterium]MBU4066408.1 chlorite dismutase family protein [Actinomycetota bacterium]